MSSDKKPTANYLELTPERKREYITEPNGFITILVPRFESNFWNKWLPDRLTKREIKINLDEIGSAVWLQINGQKNVEDICNVLDQQFGEKIKPVEDRVVKFMSQLFANKMITFKEIEK